jgi:hypothetical protein
MRWSTIDGCMMNVVDLRISILYSSLLNTAW